MAELVMPRLSDTMEEGTILRWLKRDGELISRGEQLVEIETDKATMTYESDLDGILQTVAAEGDSLTVGELIATVGEAGGGGASASSSARGAEAGAPASVPATNAAPTPTVPTPGAPTRGTRALQTPATVQTPPGGRGERVKASPLARRIAQESGVDLHALSGSGPGGRIVKADVQGAAASASGGAPAQTAAPRPAADGSAHGGPTTPGGEAATGAAGGADGEGGAGTGAAPAGEDVMTAKGKTTTVALSRMQQTIARRMAESKATIPDFTLQADVDMQECVQLRAQLKRISSSEAPTYNDMVVKACALALREHPRANGSYRDGALQLHSRINLGVAVAAQDTLVVPTVFDADSKALGEIARETRALAERVRAATITPPELGGGTFTVSNLGMYGIASFTAIVNPPQAAILSVGSVEQRALVREQQLVARHAMTLTLVCDHRILYGADAALFLARVRELLQAPAALTL